MFLLILTVLSFLFESVKAWALPNQANDSIEEQRYDLGDGRSVVVQVPVCDDPVDGTETEPASDESIQRWLKEVESDFELLAALESVVSHVPLAQSRAFLRTAIDNAKKERETPNVPSRVCCCSPLPLSTLFPLLVSSSVSPLIRMPSKLSLGVMKALSSHPSARLVAFSTLPKEIFDVYVGPMNDSVLASRHLVAGTPFPVIVLASGDLDAAAAAIRDLQGGAHGKPEVFVEESVQGRLNVSSKAGRSLTELITLANAYAPRLAVVFTESLSGVLDLRRRLKASTVVINRVPPPSVQFLEWGRGVSRLLLPENQEPCCTWTPNGSGLELVDRQRIDKPEAAGFIVNSEPDEATLREGAKLRRNVLVGPAIRESRLLLN